MKAWCRCLGTLAFVVAGACSSFSGSAENADPSDGGADAKTDDGGGQALDGSTPSRSVELRSVVSNESTNTVEAQLPVGTTEGDFLWATVHATRLPQVTDCVASTGWTQKRANNTVACSSVYGWVYHFYRIASASEPTMESPCSLANGAADAAAPDGVTATVVLAAFGGVDPGLPFEDYQFEEIPLGNETRATLDARATFALSASTGTFAVFVDPDGHNDTDWAIPAGMDRRAATSKIAFFFAPITQAGPVPARETYKKPDAGEVFCQTAEALSIILHPKP